MEGTNYLRRHQTKIELPRKMKRMKIRIAALLLPLLLSTHGFSATIMHSSFCYTLYDAFTSCSQGPGGALQSITVSENYGYWGSFTVQSEPGIPILNLILKYQSNPDQPRVDAHLYYSNGVGLVDQRNHSGALVGVAATPMGEVNTWDISWGFSTDYQWFQWNNFPGDDYKYEAIQGTWTLIAETALGFTELSSAPFYYTGATLIPEPSASGLAALGFSIYALRRRRCTARG